MKPSPDLPWLFPSCVFLFFSIFLSVKFIFIFFFRTAYEPEFLFQLNPFYLFSGVDNIQLLSISLVLILVNTFFHLRATKRRVLYSFLPTSVMLLGLGYSMISKEIAIMYIFHYVMFGCLLAVVLVDYNHILNWKEPSVIAPEKKSIQPAHKKRPRVLLSKPLHDESSLFGLEPHPTARMDSLLKQKESYEVFLQNMQALFDLLERKTLKLETLENDIEKRRENLIHQEEMLIDRLQSYLQSKETPHFAENGRFKEEPLRDRVSLKDTIKNRLIIDQNLDCVAIVQRGILKEVNNSLANLLGYQINELVNKNLFVFFTSEGMNNVKKYCEGRLKGITVNSYRTVFLSKNYTQIPAEIIVQPTLYHGEPAEILIVKGIKSGN
jgi:PAS domain S-box-containing protein